MLLRFSVPSLPLPQSRAADLIARLKACGWRYLGLQAAPGGMIRYKLFYGVERPAELSRGGRGRTFRKTISGLRTLVTELERRRGIIKEDYPMSDLPDFERDYLAACEWAAALVADGQFVVLDSETTSLQGEVIELAVTDAAGVPLFNRRIKPRGVVHVDATHVHGIKAEDLADAPRLVELLPELEQVLAGRRILIYNASFDLGCLRRSLIACGWSPEEADAWVQRLRVECLMERYAAWVGDWSEYRGSYRWQRLEGGDHSALGDCRAALATLHKMVRHAERVYNVRGQAVREADGLAVRVQLLGLGRTQSEALAQVLPAGWRWAGREPYADQFWVEYARETVAPYVVTVEDRPVLLNQPTVGVWQLINAASLVGQFGGGNALYLTSVDPPLRMNPHNHAPYRLAEGMTFALRAWSADDQMWEPEPADKDR